MSQGEVVKGGHVLADTTNADVCSQMLICSVVLMWPGRASFNASAAITAVWHAMGDAMPGIDSIQLSKVWNVHGVNIVLEVDI
jgi:hypothetical protein